jgi:antitoxin HicB
MEYQYPATLEPDEEGRVLVHFADFPEAWTDGADMAEALVEATDCLSEALASRIVDGEEIPRPTPPADPDQPIIAPSPTIALKAALYTALRSRDMTIADLAARLGLDWHLAARLIDPRRTSKLTSLSAALRALDCQIQLSVYDPRSDAARQNKASGAAQLVEPDTRRSAGRTPPRRRSAANSTGSNRSLTRFPLDHLMVALVLGVQASDAATSNELRDYLARKFGMAVPLDQVKSALERLRRAGRLLESQPGSDRWFITAKFAAQLRAAPNRNRAVLEGLILEGLRPPAASTTGRDEHKK